MSLIGGSKSSSSTTTNVETTTKTSVGDIGFTGAQGVELAAITQAGVTSINTQNSKLLNDTYKASTDTLGKLGELSFETQQETTKTLGKTFSDLFKGVLDFGSTITSKATDVAQTATVSSRDVAESSQSGPAAQIIRQAPVIVGVIIAGVVALSLIKGAGK